SQSLRAEIIAALFGRQVRSIEQRGRTHGQRLAHGRDRHDAYAIVCREYQSARAARQIDRVHEQVARDVDLVTVGRVAVRADPGDLVALDESRPDVLDAAHLPGLWVPGDD